MVSPWGGAFFGESMFSSETNASKIALVASYVRIKKAGYQLYDAQNKTDHLARFGLIEITRDRYQQYLHHALGFDCQFLQDHETDELVQAMEKTC